MSDVEVGRYAIRTFEIYGGDRLKSIYKDEVWREPTKIAKCLRDGLWYLRGLRDGLREGYPPPCLKVPAPDCHCGIYGHISAEAIFTPGTALSIHAKKSLAIIAAEGETIIGSRGLRTEAARIVGFWAAHPGFALPYQNMNIPQWSNPKEMCERYRITDDTGELDKLLQPQNLASYSLPASYSFMPYYNWNPTYDYRIKW